MPTYVDAVAVVVNCARNAANFIASFNDDRLDFSVLEKFVRRCQTCWSGADDYSRLLWCGLLSHRERVPEKGVDATVQLAVSSMELDPNAKNYTEFRSSKYSYYFVQYMVPE